MDTDISLRIEEVRAMLDMDHPVIDLEQRRQFDWLMGRAGQPQGALRQYLWFTAGDMARFQKEANRTGKAIKYYEHGKVLRKLHPTRRMA